MVRRIRQISGIAGIGNIAGIGASAKSAIWWNRRNWRNRQSRRNRQNFDGTARSNKWFGGSAEPAVRRNRRAGWRTRGLADGRRTDGRTDGPWTDRGRTVDGRPDEIRKLLYMKISKFEFSDFHENLKFGRTLGQTDGRAGWRTRGLADGQRTDDGRTVDGRPHGLVNPDGWLAG